jgi:hypothetical protein
MQMAAFGGYKVLAIDYRMPPDAPYPAAVDHIMAAWRSVVATTDPRRIAVEGTSAGGGFTLSLMLRAKATAANPTSSTCRPGARKKCDSQSNQAAASACGEMPAVNRAIRLRPTRSRVSNEGRLTTGGGAGGHGLG